MKKLSTLFILFLVYSCTQSEPETAFDKAQITQEVKEMFSNYHRDIKKDGFAAEFPYLDHSDDFYWVPPGYTSALTSDSVETILRQSAHSVKEASFDWETLQIFPLSNTIATYTGVVSGYMIDTAGVTSKVHLIESGTVIKRQGGWKLLCGQSASLME